MKKPTHLKVRKIAGEIMRTIAMNIIEEQWNKLTKAQKQDVKDKLTQQGLTIQDLKKALTNMMIR